MEQQGVRLTSSAVSHPLFLRQGLKELVGRAAYEDTELVCRDGRLLHNRLTAWLLLPELRFCQAFLGCDETCAVILPDQTVQQVTASLQKILGTATQLGDEKIKQADPQANQTSSSPSKDNPSISDDSHDQSEKLDFQNFCDEILNNDENIFIDNNISSEQATPEDAKTKVPVQNKNSSSKKKFKRKTDKNVKSSKTLKKSYEGEILPGSHPYKCTYCEKRFKQVGHANLHERTHTGDKQYICTYCQKKFNQLSHLKDHERIHTGEKPFMCSDCGKCFGYNSALKSHKKIHTGEKTYKCGFCEKTFNQLGNLRTHERLHTGELKFMCTECGKCYNTRSNLGRHACNRSLHTSGGLGNNPAPNNPVQQNQAQQPQYVLQKLN